MVRRNINLQEDCESMNSNSKSKSSNSLVSSNKEEGKDSGRRTWQGQFGFDKDHVKLNSWWGDTPAEPQHCQDFVFYFLFFIQFSNLEAEPMVVVWRSVHEGPPFGLVCMD